MTLEQVGSGFDLGNIVPRVNPIHPNQSKDYRFQLGNRMSIRDAISALISSGMDPVDAASLIAAAVIEGCSSEPSKSASALRQKRYRDRQQSVTNRNESVTPLRLLSGPETVTERNESVTNRNGVTLLSLSIEEESKKVRKKEREPKRKPRTALPVDFKLTEEMRQVAISRGVPAEKIPRDFDQFCNYHRSKGTLSADWMASWRTWANHSVEYDLKNRTAQQTAATRVDGRL